MVIAQRLLRVTTLIMWQRTSMRSKLAGVARQLMCKVRKRSRLAIRHALDHHSLGAAVRGTGAVPAAFNGLCAFVLPTEAFRFALLQKTGLPYRNVVPATSQFILTDCPRQPRHKTSSIQIRPAQWLA